MNTIWEQASSILWNILNRPKITDIIDILIVAFLIYSLLMLTRETRASQVLKGLVILLLASWISDLLGLTALNWVLRNVVNNGAVVLVILFQPELRRALEQIGRGHITGITGQESLLDSTRVISEIRQCLLNLSKRHVGALIVFEQQLHIKEIIDSGTPIDAYVSCPLLENIFEPNTPLHDGAVIVRGNRVVAAACLLTLTDNKGLNLELGTRHRAAIGMSENSDAIILVVSEETGTISYAKDGKLYRGLDGTGIEDILSTIYVKKNESFLQTVFEKTHGRRKSK